MELMDKMPDIVKKETDVWLLRRVARQFVVQTFLADFYYEGAPYDKLLEDKANQYKDDEDARKLNISTVVNCVRNARSQVKSWADGSGTWRSPLQFGELRGKLAGLLDAWRDSLEECENMRECFDKLELDGRLDVKASRKTWHINKGKICKWVEKRSTRMYRSR